MRTEDVATRFAGNLLRFGDDDPRVLEWSGRPAQQRRFQVLAEVGDLDGADVLDVGCGLGDLYGWLSAHTAVRTYVGVDASPALVAVAISRWEHEARFEVADAADLDVVLGPAVFDYVFASGLLYLHDPMWANAVLRSLFQRARCGVAVNALRAPAPSGLTGFDPAVLVANAEQMGARWVLRGDYAPHDATLYLYPPSDEGWPQAAWTVARDPL
jgi:SAM-dependent methyltransferase